MKLTFRCVDRGRKQVLYVPTLTTCQRTQKKASQTGSKKTIPGSLQGPADAGVCIARESNFDLGIELN